jgi:hypothetical protein
MGLDAVLRSAVATAKSATSALQVVVSHAAYSSMNAYGERVYAAAVDRDAIVEWKQRLVTTTDGREILSVCTVTFLEDVVVDVRDKLVLPGGQTAPLLAFKGVLDPTTSRPYATECYLGSGG